jgi:dTDP-4-dehydrorhamnose 3,5-epimerase-like enzyme
MSYAEPSLIDPRAYVSPLARVGAGCRISHGAVLGPSVVAERDVSIGPNVVFIEPESPADGVAAQVAEGVRIGANSVIHAGILLGSGAIVRPGSVVTRTVPPGAIVEGNPAAITGYVGTAGGLEPAARVVNADGGNAVQSTPVRGVTLHRFPVIPDLRGSLTVGEFERQVPFTPQRFFMVYGVPSRESRGEHAHKACHEFLICVRGSCSVMADDGEQRIETLLDAPHKGVYLPPMTWRVHYRYSPDGLLLVFASHHYDASDYIRSYEQFVQQVQAAGKPAAVR